MNSREKGMVAWVGLRGAAPIILATFPLIAAIPGATLIFDLVFFTVLTSILLQGTTIPIVARWLRLEIPMPARAKAPLELAHADGGKTDLIEIIVPEGSSFAGRKIETLGLPKSALIAMINRDGHYIVPRGGTKLKEGDVLSLLAEKDESDIIYELAGKRSA